MLRYILHCWTLTERNSAVGPKWIYRCFIIVYMLRTVDGNAKTQWLVTKQYVYFASVIPNAFYLVLKSDHCFCYNSTSLGASKTRRIHTRKAWKIHVCIFQPEQLLTSWVNPRKVTIKGLRTDSPQNVLHDIWYIQKNKQTNKQISFW